MSDARIQVDLAVVARASSTRTRSVEDTLGQVTAGRHALRASLPTDALAMRAYVVRAGLMAVGAAAMLLVLARMIYLAAFPVNTWPINDGLVLLFDVLGTWTTDITLFGVAFALATSQVFSIPRWLVQKHGRLVAYGGIASHVASCLVLFSRPGATHMEDLSWVSDGGEKALDLLLPLGFVWWGMAVLTRRDRGVQ